MNTLDRLVDDFPHGLPAGYEQGCRGARECVNYGTELPLCRDAAIRYRSDFGYKKLVDQGFTPEQIAERERVAAEAIRPMVVAARQERREKTERAQAVLVGRERARAHRAADRAQARLERAAVSLVADNPKKLVATAPRGKGRPREVKPCGTNASWARGCRCDLCVDANRAYMNEYRAKRRAAGTRAGQHGTAWGYAQGCRKRSQCPGGPDGVKCSDASLAAERDRRRAAGAQSAPVLVDAGPVLERVRELMGAGEPLLKIAERADVSKSVLKNLLYGRSGDRRGVKSSRVSAVNAKKILALSAK